MEREREKEREKEKMDFCARGSEGVRGKKNGLLSTHMFVCVFPVLFWVLVLNGG